MNLDPHAWPSIEALSLYRFMLLVRRFEEKAGQLYAFGIIEDEIRLCIGREALIAGVMMARQPDDSVVGGQRCHGHLLGLGVPPDQLMAELAGAAPEALQATPHSTDGTSPDVAVAANRIAFNRVLDGPAALLDVAAQLAQDFASRNPRAIVFAMLDGDSIVLDELAPKFESLRQGQLPVVLVVDHAQAESEKVSPNIGIELLRPSIRTLVPFQRVDGIDVQPVHAACLRSAELVRQGAGPQGLLVSTQAFRGHGQRAGLSAAARPARPRETSDPVLLLKARLEADGIATPQEITTCETEVRSVVTVASQAARDVRRSARG